MKNKQQHDMIINTIREVTTKHEIRRAIWHLLFLIGLWVSIVALLTIAMFVPENLAAVRFIGILQLGMVSINTYLYFTGR